MLEGALFALWKKESHMSSSRTLALVAGALVTMMLLGAKAQALEAPTNVQGVALAPTSIQVTWQDNSSDEDYQVVERTISGSGIWSDVQSLPANQTLFTDGVSLAEGASYAYRVRACKGECNPSNPNKRQTSAGSPDVVTPLLAPTGASATYLGPQQVQLSWTDVSLRNAAYTVERKSTIDADWETLTTTVGEAATGYTDTSALDGRSYSWRITATRTSPTSLSSGTLASTDTPWLDPAALGAALDAYARPVLTWQDNSSGELAYVIERRNDLAVYDCPLADQRGEGWCEVGQAPPNPSGGSTQFVDSSLHIDPVDPAEYQYRVHAVAGAAASADVSAWLPSCTGASPADPLAEWRNARSANGSPIWPFAIPAATDETTVSAARRGAEATLSWAACNDGTFPPPSGCDWEQCTLGETGCESPELVLLSNSRYVALFTWRGALIGLTHRLHGSEFIHPSGGLADTPHGWGVEFGSATTKIGQGTDVLSQFSSTPNPTISFEPGGVLRFVWSGIPNASAIVENTWRLEAVGNAGLRGRMQVTGTAAAGFPIDVQFPQLTQLSNAWTDADYVQPRGPGSVQTGVTDANGTQPAPSWTSQFFGFARGKAALYVATEDPSHHPKQFNVNQDVLSTFVLFPEAVVPPDNDEFSMDYDVVLAPMCVEARSDAPIRIAKRYRRFMLASDWLKRPGDTEPVPLVDRTDIPAKLRDGVYWWTHYLVKMTIYGDGLTFDADGPNWRVVGINDATGATGCGTPCLVVRYDNGNDYSNYRRVYKDLSTGGVYVYPNDGNPSQFLPVDRIYIDPEDPNWELLEGRQLASLFDIGAEQTRDKFVFDTSKWACYLRTTTPPSAPQTPIGFHVYEWYTPGFSKGNPRFDMVPGFDLAIEAVEGGLGPWTFQGTSCEAVAAGDNTVLPYINSDWGDVSDTYTTPGSNPAYGQSTTVLPMAMRLESGQHWCEAGEGCMVASGGQQLARMSVGVPAWRQLVANIAVNAFGPVGAHAIYLDTYGGNFGVDGVDDVWSSSDAPRDHVPGRGLWHVTGQRTIGQLVREQKPSGVGLVAAEHASEAFLTNVDLITWYPPVQATDSPLMQAVYSGYRMFAGPVASSVRDESVEAYAMKAGSTFVAGYQLGIGTSPPFSDANAPWVVSPNGQQMFAYSNRLTRARIDLKCYLAYGELVGPADPDPSVPPAQSITDTWYNWNGGSEVVTRPRIRGSRWVSSPGGACSAGRAIVLTNTTAADEQAHIPVPSSWADTTPQLCLPDDSGCAAVAVEAAPGGGWQTATLTVPARDVRYLRFGP
jgi:hypothetical protein